MWSLLTRLLIVISALWLIRRFLGAIFGGSHLRGQSGTRSAKGDAIGQKMVKDPVCGMYMDPRLALQVENKDGSFFFCSDECRRRFLAGP
jgi:YHS domain-containing protein